MAETVTIDALGITLDLPENARIQTTRIAGASVARVLPERAYWTLEIAARSSTDREVQTEQIARASLDALLTANALRDSNGGIIGTVAKAISDVETTKTPGVTGHRFLMQMPNPAGGPDIVRGAAVLATSPGAFLVFDLSTTEPHIDEAVAALDNALSSLDFSVGDRAEAGRALAVQSGLAVMESIDQDDLIAAAKVINGHTHRFYQPSADGSTKGETELGYRKIQAWKGNRGELNPAKSKANWSSADNQEGLLVRLDSRTLLHERSSPDTPDIVDLRSLFFVSLDESTEAWQTTMVIKPARGAPDQWTQIGARVGDSMNVTTQQASSAPRNTTPALLGDGYLPIAHTYLLPALLAKSGVPGTFGFYTFRASDETISLRRFTLSRDDVMNDGWVLESRTAPGLPPERSLLRADGSLIKQIGEGVRVWEPVELKELARIWQSKGLPID